MLSQPWPDSSLFPTLAHSPMNLMGTGRHSSSSLSSHASSEAGNMVMMGDSAMGEAPEDLYHHMQVPGLFKENGQSTRCRGLSFLVKHLVQEQASLPASLVPEFPPLELTKCLLSPCHPKQTSLPRPYFPRRKSSLSPSYSHRSQGKQPLLDYCLAFLCNNRILLPLWAPEKDHCTIPAL